MRTVSSGFHFNCAVRRSGGAACWGYDDYGQLGDRPGNKPLHTPATVVFGG